MTEPGIGFYEWMLRHERICTAVATGLFIVLCLYIFAGADHLFDDTLMAYTLFGSVAAGFLALVAFFGTVAIFRLQVIEKEISQATEILRSMLAANASIPMIDQLTMSEMLEAATPSTVLPNAQTRVSKQKEILGSLSGRKRRLQNHLINFSLLCFLCVFLAISGIPLLGLFVELCLCEAAAAYTVIMLFAVLSCIAISFGLIREAIGYGYTMKAETGYYEIKGGDVKFKITRADGSVETPDEK